jgi:putative sterol carrier protein
VKYFSDDYFKEVEAKLSADERWADDTKSLKTTILMTVSDQGSSYLFNVENGKTTIQKVEPGTTAEFSFEGTFDTWLKVGKGTVDLQGAVLKGLLKFRGSITKILFYKDRFMRLLDVFKSIPLEV